MKVLKEDKNRIAVLGWGRFNPPTIGHQLLGQFVKDTASKVGGTPMIYSSHTYKKKKDKNGLWGDPLPYEEKAKWLSKVFGNVFVKSDLTILPLILKDIYDKGYEELYLIAGSDRIDEYRSLVMKYNGVPDKKGNLLYNFKNIDFVPAGEERDDSAVGVASVSGTGTRKLAFDGDFEGFKQAVPFDEADAKELFNVLRAELGAEEQVEEDLVSEATFQDKEIPKHNYEYLDRVANDIVDDGVKLGTHGNDGVFKTDNSNAYNELMALKDIPDYKVAAQKFKEITGVKWNIIYKGTYSGHEKGQSGGEYAEPVVAYLFNHLGREADIEDIDAKWMNSCSIVSKFIASLWSPNDYVAVHVDGLDRENVGEYSTIGKLFKSKQEAEKVLNLPKGTLADLYSSGKDNWNKADIILVKKGAVRQILNALKNVKNGGEYNEILKDMSKFTVGIIVPLSLKGIGNRENPNITAEGFDDSEHEFADSVEVVLPVNALKSEDNNCSVDIYDDNRRRIQFRRQTNSYDSLSVETHASKEARGGKGITNIKRDLGLQGNTWYGEPFKSAEEMLGYLGRYFDDVRLPANMDKMINGHDTGEFAWYNRTCFRGLIHLYEAFHNKYGGDASDFFDYVYGKSASGTGAFYLIK